MFCKVIEICKIQFSLFFSIDELNMRKICIYWHKLYLCNWHHVFLFYDFVLEMHKPQRYYEKEYHHDESARWMSFGGEIEQNYFVINSLYIFLFASCKMSCKSVRNWPRNDAMSCHFRVASFHSSCTMKNVHHQQCDIAHIEKKSKHAIASMYDIFSLQLRTIILHVPQQRFRWYRLNRWTFQPGAARKKNCSGETIFLRPGAEFSETMAGNQAQSKKISVRGGCTILGQPPPEDPVCDSGIYCYGKSTHLSTSY